MTPTPPPGYYSKTFFRLIGREYWHDAERWITSKGELVYIPNMPMRQLVNTIKYVERHVAELLGIDPTGTQLRTIVAQNAKNWCPPYRTMIETLNARKGGGPPISKSDREKINKFRATLPAEWKGRWRKS